MEFAVCTLSVVPVRKEASDTSEMTTQLLFGELFIILESINKWYRIKIANDNYEGWISKNQATMITEVEFIRLNSSNQKRSLNLVQFITYNTDQDMQAICLGSTVYNEGNSSDFNLNNNKYIFDGTIAKAVEDNIAQQIIKISKMYLNAPYLWGGRTPFGIDCSGFTQIVFLIVGIKLLRDASQQANQGETINFISEAKAGDLAFFDDEEENIKHVGIILPDQKIIHASAKVRIDDIDHQGIFNKELGAYSHQLRLIKRII